jgi:hypothetical protein
MRLSTSTSPGPHLAAGHHWRLPGRTGGVPATPASCSRSWQPWSSRRSPPSCRSSPARAVQAGAGSPAGARVGRSRNPDRLLSRPVQTAAGLLDQTDLITRRPPPIIGRASTKGKPSDRTGSGLPGLLVWISGRTKRQPVARFSVGDRGEVWSARGRLLACDLCGCLEGCWLALSGAELIVHAPYTGTSIARAIVCARV